MKPDAPTNYTPVDPSTFPDVGEAAASSGSVYAAIAVIVVALLLSFAVRRVGKIRAATQFRRWLPVIYPVIWGVAIFAVTMVYASGLPGNWMLLLWLFFIILIFASVGWLRSVMSGVALAVEQRLSTGDSIRIDDIEGEIVSFGLRSIRVRSVEGTVHEIPNEKFVTNPVANLSGDGGDSACEVRMKLPEKIRPERGLELARECALLTPLGSPRHEPHVFLGGDEEGGHLEVRVRGYAFDPAYQDNYRSDVIARIHAQFQLEQLEAEEEPAPRNLVLSEE